MADDSRSQRLAEAAFRLGRGVVRLMPERLKRKLDDRFFYAVFQVTRVTNDAYPQPEGSIPDAGPADQGKSADASS